MIRTQVQLTASQAERLKRLAAQEGVSVAELIRQGVEGLLAARLPVDREALKMRALAPIGRFRSGVENLGVDHDRYFTEAARE
jgi:hypothetical protein